jgi:hypothetical protein
MEDPLQHWGQSTTKQFSQHGICSNCLTQHSLIQMALFSLPIPNFTLKWFILQSGKIQVLLSVICLQLLKLACGVIFVAISFINNSTRSRIFIDDKEWNISIILIIISFYHLNFNNIKSNFPSFYTYLLYKNFNVALPQSSSCQWWRVCVHALPITIRLSLPYPSFLSLGNPSRSRIWSESDSWHSMK